MTTTRPLRRVTWQSRQIALTDDRTFIATWRTHFSLSQDIRPITNVSTTREKHPGELTLNRYGAGVKRRANARPRPVEIGGLQTAPKTAVQGL